MRKQLAYAMALAITVFFLGGRPGFAQSNPCFAKNPCLSAGVYPYVFGPESGLCGWQVNGRSYGGIDMRKMGLYIVAALRTYSEGVKTMVGNKSLSLDFLKKYTRSNDPAVLEATYNLPWTILSASPILRARASQKSCGRAKTPRRGTQDRSSLLTAPWFAILNRADCTASALAGSA